MSGARTFIRETLQDVIAGLLTIVIVGAVGLLFSGRISSFLGITEFLWNNSLIIVLLLTGAALVVRRYQVATRRSQGASVVFVRHRPEYNVRQFKVNRYGVDWRVLYGSEMTFEQPYVFVEPSPYCPKCDYELDTKTKGGLLGLRAKHVWHCATCNQDYNRKEDLFDEPNVVEKQVEATMRSGNL